MALDFTEKGFRRAVEKRIGARPFLLALYDVLDEYQQHEQKESKKVIACTKGCSLCCFQMVSVFKDEMDLIANTIRRKPHRKKEAVMKRIRSAVGEWRSFFTVRGCLSTFSWDDPLRLTHEWGAKACPFLGTDGACEVYEVRPLPCRTTTSPIRCARMEDLSDGAHARQMRYQCEDWANTLLMDTIGRKYHGVTPFHHWLTMLIDENKL